MVENSYINTSIQKAGIQGFSGYVEHTSILTMLIKEAKEGKKNLAEMWLDLANLYGSVPHKSIEVAMNTYYIRDQVKKMVNDYFWRERFTVG
jgi:hypothetical protein